MPHKLISYLVSGLLAILWLARFAAAQLTDPDGGEHIGRRALPANFTLTPELARGALDEEIVHLDPGRPPEGDYLGCMAFTPDGQRVLVTNRMTDNVTVFDWQTRQVLANVPVGRYPAAIAANSQYAVVACAFGNRVYFIDLNTLTAVDSLPTGEQPWVIRLSPDGRTAYVACDIDDVCNVYDLDSLRLIRTITGFPVSLRSWSFNSGNGRNDFAFTEFEVAPDNGHLIIGNCTSSVIFFNTATGQRADSLTNIRNCAALGLSGDGAKLIAVSAANPPVAYRIDLASRTVQDSVVLTGYTLFTLAVAVNMDGSKCYIGISDNRSAMVRFATRDVITFTQTYTAFWIGVTPDRSHAVSGQYNFSLVSFASEQVVGQSPGYSQYHGAVAAAGGRVVAHDPHRHEGIYFFDVANPSAIVYRGTTLSGAAPEGDAPHRAAIAPDGSRALVTNSLSHNITIFDLPSQSVDTLLSAGDGPWETAITSDSRWAVVCGYNSHSVQIIDLLTNAVVADVPTNLRPCTVVLSPDNQFAYVGNIQANTVSVIALNGAASEEIAEIPCGVIGIVWAAYGVFSGMAVSPDGSYLLVAASFDDQVKVIDTNSRSVVASLTVGDFPLSVAFADNEYAVVTNYFSDNFSVLRIAGSGSQVIGTFACGDGPLRVAYNPVADVVGIAVMGDRVVRRVDPRTGAVAGVTSYAAYGSVLQVEYSPQGDEIVLTAAGTSIPPQLHRANEHTELPASPAAFALNAAGTAAVVAQPGPDVVTVVEWEAVNHPPTPFHLIEPANGDTLPYVAPGDVFLFWEESHDPDSGAVVHYDIVLRLLSPEVDTTLIVAQHPDTFLILNIMAAAGVPDYASFVRVQWHVFAVSGTDSMRSTEQWIFRLAPRGGSLPPAAPVPETYALRAHPNPFNPVTTLEIALPRTQHVALTIYDVTGRLSATLYDATLSAGIHRIAFDAAAQPSGVYFARLKSPAFTATTKLVLVK